jgi:hypothetical protein
MIIIMFVECGTSRFCRPLISVVVVSPAGYIYPSRLLLPHFFLKPSPVPLPSPSSKQHRRSASPCNSDEVSPSLVAPVNPLLGIAIVDPYRQVRAPRSKTSPVYSFVLGLFLLMQFFLIYFPCGRSLGFTRLRLVRFVVFPLLVILDLGFMCIPVERLDSCYSALCGMLQFYR